MTQTLRFLILDDDPAERTLIALAIKDAYQDAIIHETDDHNEAARICGEVPLDCLILDYNLPQIDGLSVAQKLRPSFPHLPFVLVTSVGDEMLAARALRSGISDYIPKSRINADSILRTIGHAVHTAEQARTIEEQRAELENFAHALAHDFKQPMRQIRTFSQLIADALEGKVDDEVQQYLTFLGEAARRLGNLVDVMSQYTLLNKLPSLEPLDPQKVIGDVRASLASYIEERNGEVVGHDVPAMLGNETLLTQVIQNLVVNALKYNKSTPPRVEIEGQLKNGRCLIAVRDNGIGIEERFLNDIFKPLARLHTASEYPGSGLGLTLARKAVVAQGGAIWCESTPGQGSTFWIDLAAVERRPSAAA